MNIDNSAYIAQIIYEKLTGEGLPIGVDLVRPPTRKPGTNLTRMAILFNSGEGDVIITFEKVP